MKKVEVIVHVDGGVVTTVVADKIKDVEFDVKIFDVDNLHDLEGFTSKRIDDEWEIATKGKEIIY